MRYRAALAFGLLSGALSAPLLSEAADSKTPTAPAVSAAPLRCTAVTRGKFHLRPVAQKKSAGPEHPKGTALTVLAQLPPPEKSDYRPIYQVRVTSSGAIGYAYLRRSELGPNCPLIWPGQELLKSGEPAASEGTCLSLGPAKTASALYGKKCESGKHPDASDKQIDVNGDGKLDWVVVTKGESSELAVLLNTPAGFRTLPISSGDSKVWEVNDVVSAGGAVYIIHQDSNWENYTGDSGELEQDITSVYTIYRVLEDNRAYRVFMMESGDSYETCKGKGHPDQALSLRCGQDAIKLRWDAAAKVLRATLDPP